MTRSIFASGVLCLALALATLPGHAATIIDDWSNVKVPTPPPVAAAPVDPSTTALLVLDFVKQTCANPRCAAALPVAAKLLARARASKMLVVYSYIFGGTMADTLAPVAPLGGEPSVQGGPDKFIGSDLQQILTQKGIKTVIVTGTAAQGAVLYTASHAAMAGMKVVVPLDTMPAELPYAEQFVAWNLANAPRISANVTLTTSDRVTF
jgi:nicotinamidase-related amidase